MRRRIAVVGDELTGGGQILDYSQRYGFTFHDHKAALLGGEAFCTTCKSTGIIAKDGEAYRLDYDGTENALDGDIVLCACPTSSHRCHARRKLLVRGENRQIGYYAALPVGERHRIADANTR